MNAAERSLATVRVWPIAAYMRVSYSPGQLERQYWAPQSGFERRAVDAEESRRKAIRAVWLTLETSALSPRLTDEALRCSM